MRITDVLNIDKNSIVSIVGAGGKTSLMFQLAEELKDKGRVLVTTTTKIYVPDKKHYDHLVVGDEQLEVHLNGNEPSTEELKQLGETEKSGIWVYGGSITKDNKLTAVNEEKLREFIKDFDYILIEADGSKGKPLKGWRADEPVISTHTTCTIGVLSGQTLGMEINEASIHRINGFLGKSQGFVDKEDLIEVIFNPNGMFNHSKGKRILYINQIDEEEIYNRSCDFISEIINMNCKLQLLNQIVMGSLKKRDYYNIDIGGPYG